MLLCTRARFLQYASCLKVNIQLILSGYLILFKEDFYKVVSNTEATFFYKLLFKKRIFAKCENGLIFTYEIRKSLQNNF